ncbi:hypothetical protein SAMN05443254_12183 [Bradyrhizobium sp. OK095]|nr:hypothetical protein SAMN05443254_12183 [Bradyrhizobium sp. OK095]
MTLRITAWMAGSSLAITTIVVYTLLCAVTHQWNGSLPFHCARRPQRFQGACYFFVLAFLACFFLGSLGPAAAAGADLLPRNGRAIS